MLEFSDVRQVSMLVLKAFQALPPEIRVRDSKQFVREFRNIQYEAVLSSNVPVVWPRDGGGSHYRDWLAEVKNFRRDRVEVANIDLVDA